MSEKRKRGHNFTVDEKDRLLKLLMEHRETILNKKTDGTTNQAKQNAWNVLTEAFNTGGTVYRSKESLLKMWEKLKSESKIYYTASRRNAMQTGGGPSVIKVDPILEQVCSILGRSCTGIVGALDSDTIQEDVEAENLPIVLCIDNNYDQDTIVEEKEVDSNKNSEIIEESIRKTPLWSRRRPTLFQPNERSESVATLCNSFKEVNKKKEDIEELKKQLIIDEIDFKRRLYALQLQTAERELEIKIEILRQVKGCSAQNLKIFPNQKQTVAVGKSVVLTCQADAPEPGLVTQPQWKDPKGLVINEAAAGTRPEIYTEPMPAKQLQLLYISSITQAMAGNYTCVATYANIPLSASVVLDTFIAITWTNANENQYATKGKDFKVMCEVTAEPAPSVDWFKEGTPILTGDRYVIHSNGLMIKGVEESDDGTYTCRAVVIQTGELAERNIKLEVYTAPEMEERESKVVIKEGESAAITCKARGKPPPTYMWIKSSTRENLATKSRFSVNEITGLLTFDRVEAGDYDKYICSAVNKAGQNETEIEVEVLVKPKIFELFNTTAPEKQEGKLECKATGRPAPRISFRRSPNGERFLNGPNDNGRINVETESRQTGDQMQSTGTLIISSLNRTDDGLYECIAENEGGEARKNGLLTVQFRPTFENMPTVPIWSWNAQPVNLTCIAESIPNATIKWKFRDLDLVETPQIRIYGSGPVSIVQITPTDKGLYGIYKCIATNLLGEAEHIIQFREAFPPGPVVQAKQEVITATSVSFNIIGPAEDMGPPILAYTAQFKDNTNFDWNLAKNRTWSVNSPYIVEDLQPMYSYDFRFAAVNQVGPGSWGASMTVIMPRRSSPEQPKWRENLSSTSLIHGKYADRYELKWRVPAHNGEPIDMYDITFCPVLKVSGQWQVSSEADCSKDELKSAESINYEIRGLHPDTRYRIQLRAHNVLGYSQAAELYIQTALGIERSGYAPSQLLSSGAIIGVALAGVFICLIIVDLLLLCFRRQGVIATLCGRRGKKHQEDEAKLGRDEKEPLKDTDDGFKRNSSVEFDGHRVYATSGGPIIGKNSAV